jgi:hypothetical protein
MNKNNGFRRIARGLALGSLVLPGWSAADWLAFEGEEKP